jgi:hypothetical protein
MKVCWGSGGIAPLIISTSHYVEMSGQLHAPAALPKTKTAQTQYDETKDYFFFSKYCKDNTKSKLDSMTSL